MDSCFFLPQHLFYLFHHKTRWTMSVNDVDLKNKSFKDLELYRETSFLGVSRSGPGSSQSCDLQDLGTTSWSMVWTAPKYHS